MITRKKWKLSLQEVRAILALCSANSYSHREIAESIGISHQSVGRYLSRIKESGLNVAEVMKMSDDELEEILERVRGPRKLIHLMCECSSGLLCSD